MIIEFLLGMFVSMLIANPGGIEIHGSQVVNEPVVEFINEDEVHEKEDDPIEVSPMGSEYNPETITISGIESTIYILESRLRVLEPSAHIDSIAKEIPLLQEEIQYWKDIKTQKEAEQEETP